MSAVRASFLLAAALVGCSHTPRHAPRPRVPAEPAARPAPSGKRVPQSLESARAPEPAASLSAARAGPAPTSPIPPATRQLLLSVAASWDSPAVELSRYERSDAHASWRRLDTWRAVAGRSGLAWGRGLHGNGAPPGASGPVKKEGDGRAVAGVFRLGPAFGYAGTPPAGTRLRYTHSTAGWRCVDDPASSHYDELLDASGVKPDWHSAEKLRLESDAYRLLIVVQHNDAHVPRAGSCIFLHVWKNARHGTSGCTAMPYPRVVELARWLDPAHAVFVALPRAELRALAPVWQLPSQPTRP